VSVRIKGTRDICSSDAFSMSKHPFAHFARLQDASMASWEYQLGGETKVSGGNVLNLSHYGHNGFPRQEIAVTTAESGKPCAEKDRSILCEINPDTVAHAWPALWEQGRGLSWQTRSVRAHAQRHEHAEVNEALMARRTGRMLGRGDRHVIHVNVQEHRDREGSALTCC
jgi:hypothetical protein